MKKIVSVCLIAGLSVFCFCNRAKAQCNGTTALFSSAAVVADPFVSFATVQAVQQPVVVAQPLVVPTFAFASPVFSQRVLVSNSFGFAHGGFGGSNFVNVRVGNGFNNGGRFNRGGRFNQSVRIRQRSRG